MTGFIVTVFVIWAVLLLAVYLTDGFHTRLATKADIERFRRDVEE